jgi:cysteine-rich repeat protein
LKSSTGFRVVVALVGLLPFQACTNADVDFTSVSGAAGEAAARAGAAGKPTGSAGQTSAGSGATPADGGSGSGAAGEAGEAGGPDGSSGTAGQGEGGQANAGGGAGGSSAGGGAGGVGGSFGGVGNGGGSAGYGGAGANAGSAGVAGVGVGGGSAGVAGVGGGSAGVAGVGGVSAGAGAGGASGGSAGVGGGSAGVGGGSAGVGGASGGSAGAGGQGGKAGHGGAGSGGAAPVCGNQVLEKAEQCDDGNGKNGDACSASCGFEQSQRANSIEQKFSTVGLCPNNAFGGAFAGAFRTSLQAILNERIGNGSLSLLFAFRGLADLTGKSAESISLGVAYGAPSVAPNYEGKSDLDWWYTPAAGQVDSVGLLYSSTAASLSAGVLNATPGRIQLPLLSDLPIDLSSVQVRLHLGASSAPLASSGVAPGHLASEHLRAELVSFANAGPPPPGNTDPGQLCGNLSAASLAAVPIPAAYATGGASPCSEGYSASRSFLDLLVGGCTVTGDELVSPTQPDQTDLDAPQAGTGAPYRLTTNAMSHLVSGCRDKSNATVNLAACLKAGAYSSAYRLKTGRVIIK